MEEFIKFIVSSLMMVGLIFAAIFTVNFARTLYTITTEGPARAESANLLFR